MSVEVCTFASQLFSKLSSRRLASLFNIPVGLWELAVFDANRSKADQSNDQGEGEQLLSEKSTAISTGGIHDHHRTRPSLRTLIAAESIGNSRATRVTS